MSGCYDKTVRIWDAETGMPLHILKGHRDCVNSVSFSPDGRQVVSTGDAYGGEVRIWEISTGILRHTLRINDYRDMAMSASFSPDGRLVAAGMINNHIQIWTVETGTLQQTLEVYSASSISFSPDWRQVVAFERDEETIQILNARTGEVQQKLAGHSAAILSVSGRRVVSGSADNTVRIWDARSRGALPHISGLHPKNRSSLLSFSADGRLLASALGGVTIQIWHTETGAIQQTLTSKEHTVMSVTFSPSGRQLAAGLFDYTEHIWDLETGMLRLKLGENTKMFYPLSWGVMAFSPDGKRLAADSVDKAVRIWDLQAGMLQQTLTDLSDYALFVSFSRDGRCMAAGNELVYIWDAETGMLRQTLNAKDEIDSFLTFDDQIKNDRLIFSQRRTNLLTFSHDGRLMASSSLPNHEVKIWDAKTGGLQYTLTKGPKFSKLSFSHDDSRLVTNFGCIAFDSLLASQRVKWVGYHLDTNREWIVRDDKRILWLPSEYQPVSPEVANENFVMESKTGRLLLIRFDPNIPHLVNDD